MPLYETQSVHGQLKFSLEQRDARNSLDRHENLRYVENDDKALRLALTANHRNRPEVHEEVVEHCPLCEMRESGNDRGIRVKKIRGKLMKRIDISSHLTRTTTVR